MDDMEKARYSIVFFPSSVFTKRLNVTICSVTNSFSLLIHSMELILTKGQDMGQDRKRKVKEHGNKCGVLKLAGPDESH